MRLVTSLLHIEGILDFLYYINYSKKDLLFFGVL